jgi:serine/tyrosine/threonine adenylyltransferase
MTIPVQALQDLPPLARHQTSRSQPTIAANHLGVRVSPGFAKADGLGDEPMWFACDPQPLRDAKLVSVSAAACQDADLSVDAVQTSPDWLRLLSGAATFEEVPSYATAYAGHQFGFFVPRLGDGRALCLGQVNGREFQLKGAGSTPYARHADGRAVLRSSVREFLCSEAMAALGIPTTRALSLVTSSTPVFREIPEPAAIVCRTAASFVRFGHFEYFSQRARPDRIDQLIKQLLEVDPTLMTAPEGLTPKERIGALIHAVSGRTARLMADWTSVGFMHGVMNTDNFSILGLTIDYGPFGFMEAFEANAICNHSDGQGRYAFNQQPSIGLWNIQRLLLALWSIIPEDDTGGPAAFDRLHDEVVASYRRDFDKAFRDHFRQKLGLETLVPDQRPLAEQLIDTLFECLEQQQADFTQFFRATSKIDPGTSPGHVSWEPLVQTLALPDRAQAWLGMYAAALSPSNLGDSADQWRAARRAKNPAFVLRNWVAEAVIRSLEDEADAAPLAAALAVLGDPFEDHPAHAQWRETPPGWAKELSVSCSS